MTIFNNASLNQKIIKKSRKNISTNPYIKFFFAKIMATSPKHILSSSLCDSFRSRLISYFGARHTCATKKKKKTKQRTSLLTWNP